MAKSIAVLLCQPRLVIVLFEVALTGCVSVSAGSVLPAIFCDLCEACQGGKRERIGSSYQHAGCCFIHIFFTHISCSMYTLVVMLIAIVIS